MNVVVFGATGPTGALVVERALDAGMQVRAVARTPSKTTRRHERFEVVQGDALSESDVVRAVAGQDAVVTTLGVPYSFSEITLYSSAVRHMIGAMGSSGIRRIVAVSSGGTHPGRDPNNAWFFECLLKPTIGRTLYADMRRMEELLMSSDLDWTVLRPSRLVDRSSAVLPRVAPDAYSLPNGREVSREGLARVILDQLGDGAMLRRAVAVSD